MIEDTLKEIEAKAVEARDISSNVLGLLDCVCFIRRRDEIRYIVKHDLPETKRYIILSATLNPQLYERAFDRMVYQDAGRAQLTGALLQDPRYSFSRSSLDEHLNPEQHEARLAYLNARLPEGVSIITYKGFKATFGDRAVAHFGGLVGLDDFSGHDIAVIGTPHLNPETYILFAGALNVKLRLRDVASDSLEWQELCRNGYRFWFYAYPQQSALHEIQLYFIESELVQAVGRARLVRNGCKVIVFSNYPVPGAKMVEARAAAQAKTKATAISAAVSAAVDMAQPRLVKVYQGDTVKPEAQPLKAA